MNIENETKAIRLMCLFKPLPVDMKTTIPYIIQERHGE